MPCNAIIQQSIRLKNDVGVFQREAWAQDMLVDALNAEYGVSDVVVRTNGASVFVESKAIKLKASIGYGAVLAPTFNAAARNRLAGVIDRVAALATHRLTVAAFAEQGAVIASDSDEQSGWSYVTIQV